MLGFVSLNFLFFGYASVFPVFFLVLNMCEVFSSSLSVFNPMIVFVLLWGGGGGMVEGHSSVLGHIKDKSQGLGLRSEIYLVLHHSSISQLLTIGAGTSSEGQEH